MPDRGLLPLTVLVSWLVVAVSAAVIVGLLVRWIRKQGGHDA